jgi:hypothetical protein
VIPEIDIWRVGQLMMLKRYGDEALKIKESDARADVCSSNSPSGCFPKCYVCLFKLAYDESTTLVKCRSTTRLGARSGEAARGVNVLIETLRSKLG